MPISTKLDDGTSVCLYLDRKHKLDTLYVIDLHVAQRYGIEISPNMELVHTALRSQVHRCIASQHRTRNVQVRLQQSILLSVPKREHGRPIDSRTETGALSTCRTGATENLVCARVEVRL